jgi:hypothetical protein
VRDSHDCRAGGHNCWQRIVGPKEPAQELITPLGPAESFDMLDALWRLAFGSKRQLLVLTTSGSGLISGQAVLLTARSVVRAVWTDSPDGGAVLGEFETAEAKVWSRRLLRAIYIPQDRVNNQILNAEWQNGYQPGSWPHGATIELRYDSLLIW